jgi:hypothetical protein
MSLWGGFRRRRRPYGAAPGETQGELPRESSRRGEGDHIDLADALDIDARFAEVDHESSLTRHRWMAGRLQPLIDRAVPARHIELSEGLPAARIRFADGTTLLVRSSLAGDLGIIAAMLRDRSVVATACTAEVGGVFLVFEWHGCHRPSSVRVLGLDQPS